MGYPQRKQNHGVHGLLPMMKWSSMSDLAATAHMSSNRPGTWHMPALTRTLTGPSKKYTTMLQGTTTPRSNNSARCDVNNRPPLQQALHPAPHWLHKSNPLTPMILRKMMSSSATMRKHRTTSPWDPDREVKPPYHTIFPFT